MDYTEFLDSNVIIYSFTNNAKNEKCRKALRELSLITNTLAIAEAMAQIAAITDKEQSRQALITILKLGNIRILDLNPSLIFEAMRRNQKYNLKLFDLIHYTTALLNNCQAILSYDRDFNKLEIPRKEP